MDLSSLSDILARGRILPHLTDLLPPGGELYLVGGALRDWLLGRPVADFDFAAPADPTPIARRFAAALGGSWFFLDEPRRQSRVTLRREGEELTCDFAPFRGPDLAADLRGRDFTVNALALPLGGPLRPESIIDPLGGRADLADKLLRACAPETFTDDPLRILKGVRHASTLGFRLEPATRALMTAQGPLLARSAGERIRSELGAILAVTPAGAGLELLNELGLLPVLFGTAGSECRFRQGLDFVAAVEEALAGLRRADPSGLVAGHIAGEVGDGFVRPALLKLAAFLRGYAPADPPGLLAERLHLSRRNLRVLLSLIDLPRERARELTTLATTGRGRALWADRLGPGPVEALLFLAGLDPALRSAPEPVLSILRDYLETVQDGRIPDLVDGRWLRESLGLTEGPAVGELLGRLRQAEIEGRVRTPEDGRKWLESLGKK